MKNREALRKLRSFFAFNCKMQALLILTFAISGIMRFVILYIPYKKITSIIGVEGAESPRVITQKQINIIRKIAQAVEKMSRYTPWKSECFVQALTAQLLLKMFKISNTLYLGLAKDESNKLIAHAWIRSGQFIITGYRQMHRFKIVTKYTQIN